MSIKLERLSIKLDQVRAISAIQVEYPALFEQVPTVAAVDFDYISKEELEAILQVQQHTEKSFYSVVTYGRLSSMENDAIHQYLTHPALNHDSVLKLFATYESTSHTGDEIFCVSTGKCSFSSYTNIFTALTHQYRPRTPFSSLTEDELRRRTYAPRSNLIGRGSFSSWLFKGILLNLSYKCDSACKHCFLGCGPHHSLKISTDIVKKVLNQAVQIPEIANYLVVSGGEATLFRDDVLEILVHARRLGFGTLLGTNGSWAQDYETALMCCRELKEAGLQSCQISSDLFHQVFTPPTVVENAIRAMRQHGIKPLLRITVNNDCDSYDNVRTFNLSLLEGLDIILSRLMFLGRAKGLRQPSEYDAWASPLRGACFGRLLLTIRPNGDVYPCSTGSELCESLMMGNVYEQNLHDIISRLKSNKLLYTLTRLGPGFFVQAIDQLAKSGELPHEDAFSRYRRDYRSVCELCNEIFSNESFAQAMQKLVSLPQVAEAVLRATSQLGEN